MTKRTERQTAIYRQIEEAAAAEGKSLGEWLYDALAEPFGFRNRWDAPGPASKLSRQRYRKGAETFTDRIVHALAPPSEDELDAD